MSVTPLTAAQTDANSPLDQAMMDTIRLELADHEARVSTVEDPAIRIYSHFSLFYNNDISGGGGAAQGDIIRSGTSGKSYNPYFESKFSITGSNVTCTNEAGLTLGSDNHYLKFIGNSGPALFSLQAVASMFFNSRVTPITYRARFKMSALGGATRYLLGLGKSIPDPNAASLPSDYIGLIQSSSTQAVFATSKASTQTAGTPFTFPSNGTWFEVKVVFTSVGGNQALCYIGDSAGVFTLKETLTGANLPTASNLFGTMFMQLGATGDTALIDRIEITAGGAMVDAA
jgi:hypothetical protein